MSDPLELESKDSREVPMNRCSEQNSDPLRGQCKRLTTEPISSSLFSLCIFKLALSLTLYGFQDILSHLMKIVS